MFRNLGKQMVMRISALVARNELFERYGERPTEPPLPEGAWSGSTDASEAEEPEESDDEDDEAHCTLRSPVEIRAGLQTGPIVVNHWATWCESCSTEKDVVRDLADRINVPLVGVSWDAFEGRDSAAALADVEQYSAESRLNWPHWVVDATPDAFFEEFSLENHTVPQTWVVNGDGEVVYRVDGMVGPREADEIVRQLGAL